MEDTRAAGEGPGLRRDVFGRRLYLPDINARNKQFQQAAERAAINAPMQGTAADIIKRAMITVDAWCAAIERGARLIMQVHDELVLEVRAGRVAEVAAALRERMMARRVAARFRSRSTWAPAPTGTKPTRRSAGGQASQAGMRYRGYRTALTGFVCRRHATVAAGDRAARHNAETSSGTVNGFRDSNLTS